MDALTAAATVGLLLGAPPSAGPSQASAPPEAEAEKPDPVARWNAEIAEAARRFTLPEAWIRAVMAAESAGSPSAVSPKGAMGLMQLMPETWRAMRAEYGLGDDPFEPRDNVMAGAAFLKAMYDRFGAPAFLAAYNAGPQAMEEALSGIRPLPDESRVFMAKARAMLAMAGAETGGANAVAAAAIPDGLFFSAGSGRPRQGLEPSWQRIFAPLGHGGDGRGGS
jgi:soluble lytic murein transglycosylase-like protein